MNIWNDPRDWLWHWWKLVWGHYEGSTEKTDPKTHNWAPCWTQFFFFSLHLTVNMLLIHGVKTCKVTSCKVTPTLALQTFNLKRNQFCGDEATEIESPNFPWGILEEQSFLPFIWETGLLISFLQVSIGIRRFSRGNLTSAQLDDGGAAHLRVKHLQNYIYFIVQAVYKRGTKSVQITISLAALLPPVQCWCEETQQITNGTNPHYSCNILMCPVFQPSYTQKPR